VPRLQRILRLVVAVVMAGVLPLQGWAAAAMLGCGSTGAGHALVQVPASAEHDDAVHAHHAHAQHVHEPHAAAPAASTHAAAHAHAPCSLCAACCAFLGLPASAIGLAGEATAQAYATAPSAAQPAFLTDGLERPPRTTDA
jgi:hypothetical protein